MLEFIIYGEAEYIDRWIAFSAGFDDETDNLGKGQEGLNVLQSTAPFNWEMYYK